MSLACNLRINCSPLPQNFQLGRAACVAKGHAHKLNFRLLKWKLLQKGVPHVLIAWPLSCHLHKIIVKRNTTKSSERWKRRGKRERKRTTNCNKVILSSNVRNEQTWRYERHWGQHTKCQQYEKVQKLKHCTGKMDIFKIINFKAAEKF